MIRPFCMTSMEMPRLLSEYFAARVQSAARSSARAVVDAAMRRKPAKNASDFMIRSVIRRYPLPRATLGNNHQTQSPHASVVGFQRIQVGEVDSVCSVATDGCERGLTGR